MRIPTLRKALYSLVVFALALLLAEGALALLPRGAVVSELAVQPGERGSVLCLGDSVTAGFGLGKGESWCEQLRDSLHLRRVKVSRQAAHGARLAYAAEQGPPLLAELPEGTVVLVMLGHNDFVRFEPGAGTLLRQHRFEELGRADSGWRGPRLLRLLRWATHDERPEMAGIEFLREAFDMALDPLQEAVEARSGQLVLMTYLIPGAAPASLQPDEAALLEDVRLGQSTVNALIRAQARERGLGLIDLEAEVEVGEEWNTQQWVDHIHPTEELSAAMSEAAAAALLPEPS